MDRVEVGQELHELRRVEIALQRAQLVEAGARALLVGVLDELADGHVRDAVGREPARDLLHVLPAAIGVAAVDAQEREPQRGLGLVLARCVAGDRLEPGRGVGDVARARGRLGRVPAGLVLVALARRVRLRASLARGSVVVRSGLGEASGALVACGADSRVTRRVR